MTELVPGLHWLKTGIANVYLYAGGEELILVDSGAPGRMSKILNYVRRIGRRPSDLKQILITHADWDHAGSAAAIQRETGAQVIAGPETASWLQRGASPQHLPRLLHVLLKLFARYEKVPSAAITIVEDEQWLPGPGELRALATPGHTPDHFAFFDPVSGVLFAGDALHTRRGSLALGASLITADAQLARTSARQLLALAPALFACGHGRPLSGHSMDELMQMLRQLENGAKP